MSPKTLFLTYLDDIEIPEQLKSVDRPAGPMNDGGTDKIPPNTPAHLQYYYNTRRSVEKEPDYIMHLTTSHYNKEQVSSRTPRHLSTSSGAIGPAVNGFQPVGVNQFTPLSPEQQTAPVENNSGLRPVSTDFVQSMPAPGSGTGAIGQMKKMRFPGTPPPEATTLATTPAPQTPPLTTPDPLSSVDILLTPERDFKPVVGSAPSSFPSSINDQLDQLVPIQNANLVWKDVGSGNGGDGSNAAHLGPIVIDMTGSGAHDGHSGNELAPEVIDMTSSGIEGVDGDSENSLDYQDGDVVLNIEDEELVNDILMNLEILKARGQAEELDNDPSDIMDLLFEAASNANGNNGGNLPVGKRKRRKGRKRNKQKSQNKNRVDRKARKKQRRIRLKGPSFGDKIKDVLIYY